MVLGLKKRKTDVHDFPTYAPRFSEENISKNLVEKIRNIAEEKHTTVAQLAIAWVISRGEDVIPLIGAWKRTQLQDAFMH